MLGVLDQVLQAATELGPAAAKACPSSAQLVQHAALHVGLEYIQAAAAAEAGERAPSTQQAAGGSAQEGSVAPSTYGPVSGPPGLRELVAVLLRHGAVATWAAALLQPSIEQAPELLAALVEAASAQVGPTRTLHTAGAGAVKTEEVKPPAMQAGCSHTVR